MNSPFDLLIDSYLETKVGIDTNFLTESLSAGLQQNIFQLQQDELMTVAGVGNKEVKDPNQKTTKNVAKFGKNLLEALAQPVNKKNQPLRLGQDPKAPEQ